MYDSGTNIIYESNNKTGVTQDNFYADGLLVGQLTSSNYYYLQGDALGSTRLVTTSTRSTSFSSDYIPYGENYGESGSQSFMYTGRLFDSSTGLYYLNARWYDPTIQRFMTEDPTFGQSANPISLNKYAYALDNPQKYVDPTGKTATPEDPLSWFADFFIKSGQNDEELASVFITAIVTIVPELAGPDRISQLHAAAYSVLNDVGSFGSDLGNLAWDALHGNLGSLTEDAVNIGVDVFTYFFDSLGFWGQLEIAAGLVAQGAADFFSCGAFQYLVTAAGLAFLGFDILELANNMYSQWEAYLSSYSVSSSDPSSNPPSSYTFSVFYLNGGYGNHHADAY